MKPPHWSRLAFALPALALSGPSWAEETHKLTTNVANAATGDGATLSVTVEGRNGWHINEEAPISLKLRPSEGVSVAKDKLARADLAESTPERARFDVKASTQRVGTSTIAAEANFVMCQETACKPVKETLTLSVASPAPKPAGEKPAKRRRPSKS